MRRDHEDLVLIHECGQLSPLLAPDKTDLPIDVKFLRKFAQWARFRAVSHNHKRRLRAMLQYVRKCAKKGFRSFGGN